MTILCHGNKDGHLLDVDKHKGWDTEDFVGDLSEVETLTSKRKVMIIQACRGCESIFFCRQWFRNLVSVLNKKCAKLRKFSQNPLDVYICKYS